ncbi:hypothetical protein DOTSEDRAFT_70836 [Dothistroma septosporum NZE10]|uniref:CCD97-like C-terminal domain-containing protein n=1 Tax=Dothistroma septosporum (strain NZE10 / CBS 128990) TaxID=675120 RepID=N1PR73_DOTSN|nr:hypothetical protein DOTSEDRAFT_70836 [Dothistroma septosporum NZE10]
MPHFPSSDSMVASEALSTLSIHSKHENMSATGQVQPDRIRIKNRRKRYLDLHPEYFHGAELELADPLLYDRLVRRYQSADEREKEGRQRGYTGVLEADLVRSEAKIDALKHPDPNSPIVYKRDGRGSIYSVDQDAEDRAMSRDEGWARWIDVMGQRFLRGDDGDFDYAAVDDSDDFDDREEEDRSRLEQYFQGEEAQFVGDGKPTGETGIQDF